MAENVLLSVTVSREKDEIVYRVDCSSNLTNEELEYYLERNNRRHLQMETRRLRRIRAKL
jgi:hypothetical protein